jgi:hypothetical protein
VTDLAQAKLPSAYSGYTGSLLESLAPMALASSPTCGSRAASSPSAAACARRARASTSASEGLLFSASSISVLSCGSPKLTHQSRAGHAVGLSDTSARLRSDFRLSVSVSLPVVCRPPVLTQPVSAMLSASAAVRIHGLSWRFMA